MRVQSELIIRDLNGLIDYINLRIIKSTLRVSSEAVGCVSPDENRVSSGC